jgi:hypothetical protein
MKTNLWFAPLVSCLVLPSAFAESSPESTSAPTTTVIASVQSNDTGTSAVSEASVSSGVSKDFRSLKERLSLSYFGAYFGPGLGQQNDYTPGADGTNGDVQNLDGVITAGYKVSKRIFIGVGIPLIYTPFREEKGVTMPNLFLRLADSEFIKKGPFKMALSSRFYLPTNSDSRENGFVTGIRLEQNLTYEIKKAAVTLGLYTYERTYYYNSKATGGTPFTLYAAPYLNYQFANRVAATLWIDLVQMKQVKGKPISEMENASVDFQPGLNWDVNDQLSLNPYLNLYPGNLSADSSSLGLIVSAKVL